MEHNPPIIAIEDTVANKTNHINQNFNLNAQAYSCSRCRKLKKKCSKELPVCINCLKAHEECSYPGRAPRRTKRELNKEKECIADKVLKKKINNTKSYLSKHSSPISLLTNNQPVSISLSNLRNDFEKYQENIHDQILPASSFLNILGDINCLTSLPSILNHGSVFDENNTDNVSNADINLKNRSRNIELLPPISHMQGKLVHEFHRPDSIPVKASSIQIEAVTSVFKGARTTPMITSDGYHFKCIERSLYDRSIAAYFKHNHRSYPVMNKIEFLNKVSTIKDFKLLDSQYESTFIFQLYMVMAIGCTTLQRAGMLNFEDEGLCEHFSYLAMKKFCAVMHLQNMETAKCLLLLGIYSFFEPKGISSWTISGLIMRITIGLGLNRALTAKKLKEKSLIDVEMRYRSFWSFYSFERLVHTSLGRISAIDDDNINVPLPTPLYEEEKEDIEVTNLMISLRRMGGKIYKQVYGVASGRKLSMDEKQNIINSLRNELDELYQKQKNKNTQKRNNIIGLECAGTFPFNESKCIGDSFNIQNDNRVNSTPSNLKDDKSHNVTNSNNHSNISFHSSDVWLATRYFQLQIMLYRPSPLIHKPPMESLSILGDFCLQALKHNYILYKKKMLPLNWITLFRILTICNTILYCLCQWSIDLIESKIEIQQCVEILQHFGEKWVFAAKCADVFQTISNAIVDISLSNGQVPNMDKLTRELFGATNEYQDILDENEVDVSWMDQLL